jgi:chitin disaccharide deacetylase
MLIINADDWGGWKNATDAALACFKRGRITSVSAMVFMEDSERAAILAKEAGVDVGLHINLNQDFSATYCAERIKETHRRVKAFLKSSKYSQILYNPLLRRWFRDDFQAQLQDFVRLYGRQPSHFDGHQHMHLCSNMLLDRVIPRGQKVRRSFSFWPGEKSRLNRAYREYVDRRIKRLNRTTDYFFSLGQCLNFRRLDRVAELSRNSSVELMTHPEEPKELEYLCSEAYLELFDGVQRSSYEAL